MLCGECADEREFTGKHASSDNFGQFFCIRSRGCSSTGNTENFKAFVLGIDSGPATNRAYGK
jgi:hypothetical protein